MEETNVDWKANWQLVDRRGDDALCVHVRDNGSREFVVARGYDDETGHWASGEYFESLALAAGHLEGRAVSTVDSSELVLASYWTREDIRTAMGDFDVPVTEENVDMVVERLGLDGGWDAFETLKSPFNEELCMTGNEFIAEEVAWMRKEMGEGEAKEGVRDGLDVLGDAVSSCGRGFCGCGEADDCPGGNGRGLDGECLSDGR